MSTEKTQHHLQSRHVVTTLVVGRAFRGPPFSSPHSIYTSEIKSNHVTPDKQMYIKTSRQLPKAKLTMVVFADQYSRQLPKGRNVQCLKELALVSSTVAIESESGGVLLLVLLCEGKSASEGHLRADDTVPAVEVGVLLVEMHGSTLPAGAPGLAAHELGEGGDEVPSTGEVDAVVTVGGDDGIRSRDGSLHSNGDGLLAVVEVAEPADELGLIEGVGGDLHAAHQGHVAEEGHELGGGGGDVAGRRVDEVGGEGDGCLDGERRRGVGDRARRHEGRGRGPRGGDATEEGGRCHGDDSLGFRRRWKEGEEGRSEPDEKNFIRGVVAFLRRGLAGHLLGLPRAGGADCSRADRRSLIG
jgi:hypothetical protein